MVFTLSSRVSSTIHYRRSAEKKEDNRKERFLLASSFSNKYNYFSSYLEQLQRSVSKTKQKSLTDQIVYGQRIEKRRHVNQMNQKNDQHKRLSTVFFNFIGIYNFDISCRRLGQQGKQKRASIQIDILEIIETRTNVLVLLICSRSWLFDALRFQWWLNESILSVVMYMNMITRKKNFTISYST